MGQDTPALMRGHTAVILVSNNMTVSTVDPTKLLNKLWLSATLDKSKVLRFGRLGMIKCMIGSRYSVLRAKSLPMSS